jgi:phage I-like protein
MNEARLFTALPTPVPLAFRIFPRGTFRATQFVSGKIARREYLFDEAAAESVMASYLGRGNPRIVIDYEHASMAPAERIAEGAPAAGWFSLEVRDGELWAVEVEWTPRAKRRLEEKEYAAFSPVFIYDREGRVTHLRNLALTNDPAMDSLPFLVAARAVDFEGHPLFEGAWDADAAVERLRKWAYDDARDRMDWRKYAEGFAYVTGDGDKLGDFHLPHHDVRDGKLVTSKRGVEAAAAAVQGARGGIKLGSDEAAVKRHLASHFHQWGSKAPWEAGAAARGTGVKTMDFSELPALPEGASEDMKAMRSICNAMLSAMGGAMEELKSHKTTLLDYATKIDGVHETMKKLTALPSKSDVPPDTTPHPKPMEEGEAVAKANATVAKLFEITGTQDADEALGMVMGLKTTAGQAAALAAKVQAGEVDGPKRQATELVETAIKEKKVLPSERESLIGIGTQSLAMLRGNLKARAALPGIGEAATQAPAATGEGQKFAPELVEMARKANISLDTLNKYGKA